MLKRGMPQHVRAAVSAAHKAGCDSLLPQHAQTAPVQANKHKQTWQQQSRAVAVPARVLLCVENATTLCVRVHGVQQWAHQVLLRPERSIMMILGS